MKQPYNSSTLVGKICGRGQFLSPEWKRDGVMDDDSGDDGNDKLAAYT